jgi:hypothetical protein
MIAFYSATTKTYTDAVLTPGDAGNTLTAPSSATDFSGTVNLPANLPAGTQVHGKFLFFYDFSAGTAGDIRQFNFQVNSAANRGGTVLCGGESLDVYRSNGNNGIGPVAYDCHFTVLTTGTSGTIHGPTTTNVWIGDKSGSGYADPSNTGTTLHAGISFPSYDSVGTQTTGYVAASATTFNTTQAYTLRASVQPVGTSTNITYKLREFSMIVTLP